MTRTASVVLAFLAGTAGPVSSQMCPTPSRLESRISFGAEQGVEFDVRDVEIGRDGQVFVTQLLIPHVTILSPNGGFAGTIGRMGDGPGEFEQAPWSLGFLGDTLWVAEHPVTGLVHFFGPDGEFIRRARHVIPTGDGVLRVTSAEPLAGGSFLGGLRWPYNHLQPDDAVHPIVVLGDAGMIRDTLALYPFPESPVVGERWWGPSTLWRYLTPLLAEDGSGVLWVSDHPEEGRFAIMKGRPSGTVSELFSVSYRAMPISRRDRARILDTYLDPERDTYAGPAGRARYEMRLQAFERTLPEAFPPVRAMIPGHSGEIWLLRERREDGADRWEVYAEDGSLLDVVVIDFGEYSRPYPSPRIDIHHVDGNEVWASTRGEFDEVTLHRFEVVPGC